MSLAQEWLVKCTNSHLQCQVFDSVKMPIRVVNVGACDGRIFLLEAKTAMAGIPR
ncbi:hypothetical protein BDZ45DRAFT_596258 [Acephala macrosclerotiorum]|nr:hypothetical protein BDZ45DRAFT_596258 [Acephala macrosclerotiorum]